MAREEAIAIEGTVVEVLPNNLFRVEFPNGHRILAHTSSTVRFNFIRFGLGDKVTVEMSPYDLSKGAITLRQEN